MPANMTQPNQFTPRPSPRSCYNALDRHVLAGRGGDSCMIFEGNDKGYESTMTYAEVLAEVSRVVSACRGARRGIEVGMVDDAGMKALEHSMPGGVLRCCDMQRWAPVNGWVSGREHRDVKAGMCQVPLGARDEACRCSVHRSGPCRNRFGRRYAA